HALANPELAPTLLFLGLAVMAALGTRSIDKKGAARPGWPAFAAVTSNVPFAALIQGRAKAPIGQMIGPLVIGVVIAGAILWAHPMAFGVNALPN
ncbi:MAG: NnrU family protein, partial [Alphaproteobacteria bacterium]|nr:NnrU family protein [Alphaproteobacteria bacterium]